MLRIGLAPGLSPSPGRSWLRTTLLVPIDASRSRQCTGHGGGRPTRFRVTRMGTRGAADFPGATWGSGPGGGLGGGSGGGDAAGAGRGIRAVRPVAVGPGPIYRPSTIREQDHKM
ncbi:hypothetical protein GCM10010305_28580 [Streptomyces termitum]|uniref:Uncharacterized protein n=1 Tax=Streptomyces termitum TaxID=67368 RepID=A0A918T4C6_9ACTN|nr:hypothetical protein GCM10010305_28580 [Streptomyces termitum]